VERILAGTETEYGLLIEGRGAEDQVEDSAELVRGYPGPCFVGWDYRYESPRADLRGFRIEHLAVDPEDARYDRGRHYGSAAEIRADRILPNGARLYNDHGHPEYSTPECLSIFELSLHDCSGQRAVLSAAKHLESRLGREVRVFKNNTDFHGASYGTHENYLVPRSVPFDDLYAAVLPMLIARQVLTGAGKVGSESGRPVAFQLSQRADFFAEPVNTETLFRRPIFNTRDEPHADPRKWVRLHVISGDANMIPACTARKIGLVKLALALAREGAAPLWRIKEPVQAFQNISRDEKLEFRIDLAGGSWTTAGQVLESYFAAAEQTLNPDSEANWVIQTSRQLLEDLHCAPASFRREVDWAAKKFVLEQYIEEEGTDWRDPSLRAFDLEYHNPDPETGLHSALVEMGTVEPDPTDAEIQHRLQTVVEPTRAFARSVAVTRFQSNLETLSWGSMVFRTGEELVEVELPPEAIYPAHLGECSDVGSFIQALREVA
jgi:proteasome accessory factor A